MFADISGSTRLFETLGDTTARAKIAECLELLTEILKEHNGTVIKTIGDEIMCTYPTAEDAAEAACEMHERLEDEGENSDDGVILKIRVGMHYGPAIMEKGDVFGDAVNVAARMAAQAKATQIITTESTVQLLSPALRAGTRFVDKAPIKGKQDAINIFEIIWQEEDVTRMATGMLDGAIASTPEVKLRVTYNGQMITLDKQRTGIVIGRSQGCDLPVNEKLASRQHVKIEQRRDKYFIIDQSTNGTHVLPEGNPETFLRREEMALHGSGQISLGKSFTENPTEVITFHQITE